MPEQQAPQGLPPGMMPPDQGQPQPVEPVEPAPKSKPADSSKKSAAKPGKD
jgi:hypothetical protein